MMFINSHRNKINRYTSVIVPFIGVLMIILMLALIWFWETSGRELYFYEEVVVFNHDIKQGTIITEDMLDTINFEADKIIASAIVDKNQIIGLEALQFIPKKTQLHPYYFANPDLTTDSDKYIIRLPNEWLYSIPNTLRRRDEIILYGIKNNNSMDNSNNEYIATHNSDNLIDNLGKIILQTKVAYVKDRANREVYTIGNEARIDGSSVISEVLILASKDEFQKIEKAINNGNKLIIMHSEGEVKDN